MREGYVSDEEAAKVIRRSKINLGVGGIGFSKNLTNSEGGDSDIPAGGGGIYIISFNSDLALHYQIGKEIVCYNARDEVSGLVRYYLSHTDEARETALAVYWGCLSGHGWLHR